jgi:hypothetical protein
MCLVRPGLACQPPAWVMLGTLCCGGMGHGLHSGGTEEDTVGLLEVPSHSRSLVPAGRPKCQGNVGSSDHFHQRHGEGFLKDWTLKTKMGKDGMI